MGLSLKPDIIQYVLSINYPTGKKFSFEFKFRYAATGKFAKFKFRVIYF